MNRPQLEQLIRDSLTQTPETQVHMLAARIRELEGALKAIWPFVEEDDGGFATPQYQAAINKVRSAICVNQGGAAT